MTEIEDSFSARLGQAIKAIGGPARPPARTLVLHIGEADKARVEAVASKTPEGALLLYLATKGSASISPGFKREFAGRGILVEDFEMSGFLRERIFASIESIHGVGARLSAEKELPKETVQWIQTVLADGFEKRNDRMRTLQTRIRCAIANFHCIIGAGRLELPSFDPSVPVIICGAGPSIKGQLDYLREIQGNAVLISAGRAVKMLSEAGISPDYVVDIEQKAQLYWPEGLRFSGVLVAHESIAPVVSKSFGKFIWTDCGMNPLRGLLASCGVFLPSIPAHGPVASIMLGFALACGARRIGLCGYDLSLAPDGKAYADGRGAMDKDSAKGMKVPSVAGGTIDTLHQFEAMRRDVQSTIDILRKTGLLFEIYNCSPWGAVISGTMPMTLKGFAETFAKSPKSTVDVFAPIGEKSDEALTKALSAATKAQDSIASLTKNVAKILAALSSPAPDFSAVQELERKMGGLFKDELSSRSGPSGSELSAGAFEQARLISEQWPRRRPANELDARRSFCKMLLRQSFLHENFLKDSIQEIRHIIKARAEGHEVQVDVHIHPALREHAIRLIGEANQELATRLRHMPSGGRPEGFDIFHMLLSPPIVLSMTDSSGSVLRLADASSYTEQIQAAATSLLKDSAFDPAQDAIILLGHVNWGLASEIAFRNPGARMLVVYPWIELISHMADTCEFMGLLPEDALLVCPSEECQDWRKVLEARITLWKGSVRRILLFENEAVAQLPESRLVKDVIKAMLS